MARLHFHPIQGKALDIIHAILHTREVASVGEVLDDIHLVVEELVVNITDYAGSDYLDVEIIREKERITFRFRDGGVPFNPLEQEPPDISLPMGQRKIGGLGIYLVILRSDSAEYEYKDGENVLTIVKNLSKQTIDE